MAEAFGQAGTGAAAGDSRLRSWKEIGRWFGVDERTVKRWEVSRGLPVHRVPGEARAAVFAYEGELAAWLKSRPAIDPAIDPASPVAGNANAPSRAESARQWMGAAALAVVVLAVLGIVIWQRWQSAVAQQQQQSQVSVADVRQLARSQVAEISDRLERQPGTVRLRVDLAREAATVLARVAAQPTATPPLRQEAAEAYRRLAMVQNATDRPSLRDRTAARSALDVALRLVDGDDTPSGRLLRARILIDAARQAAADGAVAMAGPMLAKAVASSSGETSLALHEDLQLAQSEIAQWQGDYAKGARVAGPVAAAAHTDLDGRLRQLRGLDLIAEANFYAGDKNAALVGYLATVRAAKAALARWPDEPRLHWAVLRQQWNLGSTLTDMGRSGEALAPLASARDGWMAMAKSDPGDESVASWVRTTRTSYGEALAGAGRTDAAITELAASLADRRNWLAADTANAERRRALIVGVDALADVLAAAGRRGEACALFAEASGMAVRMEQAGTLTGLDRDSMVKQLNASRGRYCSATLTRKRDSL